MEFWLFRMEIQDLKVEALGLFLLWRHQNIVNEIKN